MRLTPYIISNRSSRYYYHVGWVTSMINYGSLIVSWPQGHSVAKADLNFIGDIDRDYIAITMVSNPQMQVSIRSVPTSHLTSTPGVHEYTICQYQADIHAPMFSPYGPFPHMVAVALGQNYSVERDSHLLDAFRKSTAQQGFDHQEFAAQLQTHPIIQTHWITAAVIIEDNGTRNFEFGSEIFIDETT